MAIDPNIALGYKGVQLESPLNQYAQVSQIQNAQNQNALAQFQMRAAQRGEQDNEALRNALAGTKYGTPEYDQALTGAYLKTGNVKGLQEYQKGERETNKAAAELQIKQQEVKRSIFGNLAMNTSDENVKAHLQDLVLNKTITPEQAQSGWAEVKDMNAAQRKKHFTDLAQTADQRVGNEISRENLGVSQGRLDLERQRVGLEGRRVNLAEEDSRLKREGVEGIAPKELQKREAALPAATASVKGFEAKSDSFIRDLIALRDHPGLEGITGAVYGRTPSVGKESSAAQALYDKVVAKGGFQALQDLRDASKTGGALGNVSNQEGKQLSSSFAAIQRTQSADDVKAAINQAIADIEGAKTRTREAYDSTYSYKRSAPAGGVDAANPLLK